MVAATTTVTKDRPTRDEAPLALKTGRNKSGGKSSRAPMKRNEDAVDQLDGSGNTGCRWPRKPGVKKREQRAVSRENSDADFDAFKGAESMEFEKEMRDGTVRTVEPPTINIEKKSDEEEVVKGEKSGMGSPKSERTSNTADTAETGGLVAEETDSWKEARADTEKAAPDQEASAVANDAAAAASAAAESADGSGPADATGDGAQKRFVSPKDFVLLKVIGMGAFGKVLQVRNKHNKQILAMKVISKRRLRRKSGYIENIQAERKILTRVRHPFVVSMHCSFQTKEKLFIIMDFLAGGELFLRLGREGIFLEKTAAFYLAEIILALDHLHVLGILHRDLKPENILLGSDGHVCLTDFGLAKDFSDDGGFQNEEDENRALTICGTQEYMAPEMVAQKGYGRPADYWSLGCIAYEMLSGLPPFQRKKNEGSKDLFRKIMSERVKMPDGSSAAACKLLKGLLNRNAQSRLGTARSTMFEVGGVAGLKKAPFFKHIDWDKLERKEIDPPQTLSVQNEEDLRHFHDEFVNMTLPRSVVIMSGDKFKPQRVESEQFRGFSFIQEDFALPERQSGELKSYWESAEADGESASDCASSKDDVEEAVPQPEQPEKKKRPPRKRKKKKDAGTASEATTPVGSTATTPVPSAVNTPLTSAVNSPAPSENGEPIPPEQALLTKVDESAIASSDIVPARKLEKHVVHKTRLPSVPATPPPPPPPPQKPAKESWQAVGASAKKKASNGAGKQPQTSQQHRPPNMQAGPASSQLQRGQWAMATPNQRAQTSQQHPSKSGWKNAAGQGQGFQQRPQPQAQTGWTPSGAAGSGRQTGWGVTPKHPGYAQQTSAQRPAQNWHNQGRSNQSAGQSSGVKSGTNYNRSNGYANSAPCPSPPSSDWRQHSMSPRSPQNTKKVEVPRSVELWPSLATDPPLPTKSSKIDSRPQKQQASKPKLQGAWASRGKP